ncbi:MAG: pseudouridine synthase [Candidatus Paceibacterota bacterium]
MNFTYPIRINRYLALNNYATRKGADVLVEKGHVLINGKKAILGDLVYENDEVEVRESAVKRDYVYYAYNKARGVSTNPEKGCKDILKITKFNEKVFPVGRLDKDSHGLIIMTNDGRITDRLLSPKYIHEKEYVVKLKLDFSDIFLDMMGTGIRIDGFTTKKCKIWRATKAGKPSTDTFKIILTEGKKRQIRRMCEALHHDVLDLFRTRIMNIQIGKIADSDYRKIEGQELKDFLGLLGIEK